MNKLTEINSNQNKKNNSLIERKKILFKISIEQQLDNNFCFKDLKNVQIKAFHNFIEQTVNQSLTISEVDNLFKRKEGPKESITIKGNEFELIHLGKDRTPERIFGYYNPQGYFVLTRLDFKHKTHKRK